MPFFTLPGQATLCVSTFTNQTRRPCETIQAFHFISLASITSPHLPLALSPSITRSHPIPCRNTNSNKFTSSLSSVRITTNSGEANHVRPNPVKPREETTISQPFSQPVNKSAWYACMTGGRRYTRCQTLYITFSTTLVNHLQTTREPHESGGKEVSRTNQSTQSTHSLH